MGIERLSEIPVFNKIRIEKQGPCNFDKLGNVIETTLKKKKYKVSLVKGEQKKKGSSSEVELKYKADKKVDDYHKFAFEIEIKAKDVRPVVVKYNNKETQTVSADLVMVISVTLIKDYKGVFKNGKRNEFLRFLYDKYIIKNRTKKMGVKIVKDFYTLESNIKENLNAYNP